MLIKPDGAGAGGDATNQPSVHDCKHHEGGDRNKKQQIARVEMAQAEQDPDQTDCGQCELRHSQPAAPGFESGSGLPTVRPAAAYILLAAPGEKRSRSPRYLSRLLFQRNDRSLDLCYRSDGAGFGAGAAEGGAGGSGTPSSFAWNSMIFCNIS